MQLSPMEILVVAIVALIVLGPDRLPKAARQVGKAIAELKRVTSGVQAQVHEAMQQDAAESGDVDRAEADRSRNPDTKGFKLIDDSDGLPEDQPSRGKSVFPDSDTVLPSNTSSKPEQPE